MTVRLQDTVASLEAIHRAMEVADRLVEEAMQEHARAFAFQIREKIGAEAISLQEPYLASELARFQLQFVKTMARLFAQVETLLPPNSSKGQEATSEGNQHHKEQEAQTERLREPSASEASPIAERSIYGSGRRQPERPEKSAEQGQLYTKAIDPTTPVTPQVEERIAIESVRLSRRVKQSLDGKRQRAYGLRRYIWRSQDDKKVRVSHAVNDDKIFEWDNPPPTGHPGDDYGCRCWAEPILDGAEEEPLPEGVEVAVLVNPATVEVAVIIVNALDKLNKGRKLLQAARAAEVLAQEIQQQEEEGDAEASQPPAQQPASPPEPPDDEEDKTPPEEGKDPPSDGRTDTDWKLGKHKSETKWKNQMEQRDWTEEEITDTIKYGKEYKAPNQVRRNEPGATATRYEKDGKFVVRDDQTREILQISGDKFIPQELP